MNIPACTWALLCRTNQCTPSPGMAGDLLWHNGVEVDWNCTGCVWCDKAHSRCFCILSTVLWRKQHSRSILEHKNAKLKGRGIHSSDIFARKHVLSTTSIPPQRNGTYSARFLSMATWLPFDHIRPLASVDWRTYPRDVILFLFSFILPETRCSTLSWFVTCCCWGLGRVQLKAKESGLVFFITIYY